MNSGIRATGTQVKYAIAYVTITINFRICARSITTTATICRAYAAKGIAVRMPMWKFDAPIKSANAEMKPPETKPSAPAAANTCLFIAE